MKGICGSSLHFGSGAYPALPSTSPGMYLACVVPQRMPHGIATCMTKAWSGALILHPVSAASGARTSTASNSSVAGSTTSECIKSETVGPLVSMRFRSCTGAIFESGPQHSEGANQACNRFPDGTSEPTRFEKRSAGWGGPLSLGLEPCSGQPHLHHCSAKMLMKSSQLHSRQETNSSTHPEGAGPQPHAWLCTMGKRSTACQQRLVLAGVL